MKLTFEIELPSKFKKNQLDDFLKLLIKQNQVSNPSIEKIKASSYICIVYYDDLPIGIGAIKKVYNKPFDYAKVSELKNNFNFELGYLYVSEDGNYQNFGIGKTISKLLLKKLGNENIFATTEKSEQNSMIYILENLKFIKIGETYVGKKTKKSINLYVRTK